MEKENREEKKIKNRKINTTVYCLECGFKLDKNVNFCENCGAKTESVNDKIKETEEEFDTNMDYVKADIQEEKRSNPSKISILEAAKTRENNSLKDNRILIAVVSSLVTLLVCMTFTVLYCRSLTGESNDGTTSSINKDVTITDTGIAESVNKVYDSVVVVKTYVNGKLYSTGTGFVYKTDDDYGYILTNNHVIQNGTEIKVVFTDDTEETVKVVGTDVYSDIALLSVDKDAVISVAEIGSSEDMEVGDTTFAVGAPINSSVYSWTVTRGILSGKNRLVEVSTSSSSSLSSSTYVMSVMQTDTAINSGNSGGPLCNANGEVIGITNMKIASSSVEGMGFAIPIETATEYAEKFISGDPILRPYLGISMYDMSNSIYGTSTTGIYIAAVENDSPAAKAGLQKGDVITEIGGVEVASSSYLKYELYKYDIGDKVEVTYTRNSKENKTTITLGSTTSQS